MGVDLIAVINHKMTKKELKRLPSVIDSWQEIYGIIRSELPKIYSKDYIAENYSKVEPSYFNNNMGDIKSSCIPSEEFFDYVWKQWEKDKNEELHSIQIITYFSLIKIRRNTLIIEQMPWHKYSNLHDKDTAKMILEINRIIASKLDQNKVVYFPDSAYPTSYLYDFALEGKVLEELILIGDQKFPEKPTEIKEGIKFRYFVDDFSEDLSNLEDLDNSEKYWKYNFSSGEYERTEH